MRRFSILLLLLLLCSPTRARDSETTYEDKLYHYSVALPNTWRQADSKIAARAGVAAAFFSPSREHPSGTITVQVATCPDLASLSAKSLRDIDGQGTLLVQQDLTLGKVPGKELLWSAVRNGKKVRYVSAFFVVEGKSYTLNALCPDQQWNAMVLPFRRAAATFKYLP